MNEFNASELVSLSRFPMWVLVAAGLVLAVALALSWRATRGAPPRVRSMLFGLRALLAVAVLVLLIEPGVRYLATSKLANRVVLAVDTSGSMNEPLAQGEKRTRVRAALDAAQKLEDNLKEERGTYQVEVWTFDEGARPLAPASRTNLATGADVPAGKSSDLGAIARALGEAADDRPLGGVVIFSDGDDTERAQLDDGLRKDLANIRANGPVHTVLVGEREAFVDIAIDEVVTADFAFVRNPVELKVRVRQRGFDKKKVSVVLREDGHPVAVRELILDGPRSEVRLEFEPKSAGKHVYTVEIPPLAKEAIKDNNRKDVPLKIIRDRIRVLQLVGRPSWDERFVRRLLKENPSVDLISFFILRSTTDVAGAPPDELSLIPFPTRELFTEQLHTFDVVIFQDFNYGPYQMAPYLKNVKSFVEESGGGFMMIGGELSFSEGDYAGTPIADVLPVDLMHGHGHLSEEPFKPRLTEAGKQHPITDLGSLAEGGYGTLPPLTGVNLVAGIKDDAEVLLAHPFLNAGGGPAPVVAVREVGRGRSVAIMTDTTWSWALPHVGAGGRGDAHRRFFANALRWLIRDPELSRVKVTPDRADYEPDDVVSLSVRSFDARYQPKGGAEVELEVQPLGGGATRTEKGVTDDTGTLVVELKDVAAGPWRVRATASVAGASIGADENAFVVQRARKEAVHVEPRAEILQAMAGAGAGRFVHVDEAEDLELKDHGAVRVHRQRTEPLWSSWWPLVVVVALAATEWWWRRRRGLA